MLPAVVAHQIQQELEHYLRTTFAPSTDRFERFFDRFFEHGRFFAGPYVSLGLPLTPQPMPEGLLEVAPGFEPYEHQLKAFRRLAGDRPKSTIVGTGTGSGKTEAYLYPILDACARAVGEPGIKAILIFPMNALANDQAERLARIIHGDSRLKNRVSGGLFTGDRPGNHSAMGPDHLVTNHEAMLAHPPDIVLTNYRMLDLLLMRPSRAALWAGSGPESLRFLVVDELHTFDGAQGTDLAVLIRRLKERLGIADGALTCVGTSATIGGARNAEALREYARSLFSEPFDDDSVIGESAQPVSGFLAGAEPEYVGLIGEDGAEVLDPAGFGSLAEYIHDQAEVWFEERVGDVTDEAWRLELNEKVKRIEAFQRIARVASSGPVCYEQLVAELSARPVEELSDDDARYFRLVVTSLLSLAGWARRATAEGTLPALRVGVQLWMRELRRVVAPVVDRPSLAFWDNLSESERRTHLPIVHCRECNANGWVAYRHDTSPERIETSYSEFISRYFANSPETVFLFPPEDEHEREGQFGELARVCAACLNLYAAHRERCPNCGNAEEGGAPLVEVHQPVVTGKRSGHSHVYHNCPVCQGHDSLLLVGSRSTSLLAVALAQLHASPYSSDKKALAFSDSVQDAAHHAGFFGARTYSFNLRMALGQFFESARSRRTQRLDRLVSRFIDHYRSELGDERYVAVFLAPRLEALPEFERLLTAAPGSAEQVDESMIGAVSSRLNWDIHAELCYMSEIGRTLEKSGVLAVYPDPGNVDAAVEQLTEDLGERIGTLRGVKPAAVGRFVRGLLSRMRRRGAVLYDQLEEYLEHAGDFRKLGASADERAVLPWAGPLTRLPAFLADGVVGRDRFDRIGAADGTRQNWYQRWVAKSLFGVAAAGGRSVGAGDYDRDILLLALDVLARHGVVVRREVAGHAVWAIPESALLVTSDVVELRCDHHGCNYRSSVAKSESARWTEAPCPRIGCRGVLRREEESSSDYYSSLYRRGELSRVIPAEHSSIVSSEERERIEKLFSAEFDSAERKPWHPNLVSSTPTLEMGIDIGDLSATIQTRVPPRPANYIQRIGRSGRKSGSALNLTVATGRPHDLYFMKEPESMIAAEIEPPGLFLNAPYVLKRQLLAFAFDRWVASGISATSVPARMNDVLSATAGGSGRFPWNLLEYVRTHAHQIQEAFLSRFADGELDEHSKSYLAELLHGDIDEPELIREFLERIEDLRDELHSLEHRLSVVRHAAAELRERPHLDSDGEAKREELERQQKALETIIARLRRKNTFEFLADEGLVPNFSFPEAGVVLRSVILRRSRRSTEGGEPLVFEYQRPAVAALSELAPEAEFYGQGRRVTIQQIDLRTSEVEEWRICDTCHHMEREATGSQYTSCPRCGSRQWTDTGRKRNLLTMKQVIAVEPDRRSRIYDETEERTPTFFSRNLFVDVDPKQISDARVLEGASIPFGFEFVRNVTLRDLNFGRSHPQSEPMRFGGMELRAGGFYVCRHCGAVLPSRRASGGHSTTGFGGGGDRSGANHAGWCPVRTGSEREEDAFSAVFLYRDYTSEAIRLLIPTGLFAIERQLESFVAALFLGLRRHFGGRVDHINSTHMYLPGSEGGPTEHYLVLYDSVPGGTGYLKQLLADVNTLRSVLELALRYMQACDCEDGCHRCVYSYRQAHAMERISKQEAIKLFGEIIRNWESLRDVHGSVAGHGGGTYLESNLEAAFVYSLRAVPEQLKLPVSLQPAQVRGKAGWALTLNGHSYRIEPQPGVGFADGVSPPSRPDFMIRPVDGAGPAGALSRPVAVFTDGFSFHADVVSGNLVTGSDACKRVAIRESGKYWVWSLTYDDVVSRIAPDALGGQAPGRDSGRSPALLDPARLKKAGRASNDTTLVELASSGSLQALIGLLACPDEPGWRRVSAAAAVALGTRNGAGGEASDRAWASANLEEIFSDERTVVTSEPARQCFCAQWPERTWIAAAAAWAPGDRSLRDELADPRSMRAVVTLRDDEATAGRAEFKEAWSSFWNAVNLLQFLPEVRWGTTSVSPLLDSRWGAAREPGAGALEEVLRLVPDPEIASLVDSLAAAGLPLPEPGHELVGDGGVVVAEAELAWEEAKVAVVIEERGTDGGAGSGTAGPSGGAPGGKPGATGPGSGAPGGDRRELESRGWRVFVAGRDDLLDALKGVLS